MNTDSEDMSLGIQRGMSFLTFLRYSIESTYRQKIQYKLANAVEKSTNTILGENVLDITCRATPPPDSDLEQNPECIIMNPAKEVPKIHA